MRRIDDRTVEMTCEVEMVIAEIVDRLVDQGMSGGEAVIKIRGSLVPEGLRSPAPLLEAHLTPEFVDWLCE